MTAATPSPGATGSVLGLTDDLQPALASIRDDRLLVSTRGDQVRAQAATRAAVLDGRSVLRISIGSHTTRAEHVDAAWSLLADLAP